MRSPLLNWNLFPSSRRKSPRIARSAGRRLRLECLEDRTLLHPKFIIPLGGVAPYAGVTHSDWSIVNYVDLTSGPGVQDYHGGDYTYDGHAGIDMTLPNFAAMDKGVKVFAAADGVVEAVHDGESDRHTTMGSFPANYVVIDHGDGWETYYYHFRTNSITVKPGQKVKAGDTIGLAGSSGSSTMAHLHFEVHHNGAVVETYLNPAEYWVKPLPYAGDTPGYSDIGLSDHVPTSAEWLERPQVRTTYNGLNAPVDLWAYVHGIKATDSLQVRWLQDGTEYGLDTLSHGEIRWGHVDDSIFALPAFDTKLKIYEQADWKAEFLINGKVVATQNFVVKPGTMFFGDAIQFSSAAYTVNEGASQATITVTRTGSALNLDTVSSVRYVALAGTAVANTDFVPTSGILTFQVNQASKTFTIPLISHLTSGTPKTIELNVFPLTVSGPVDPGDHLGEHGKAVLTIEPVPGKVQYHSFSNDVDEGAGKAVVWVDRVNGGAGNVSVHYEVKPGTAQPGLDYTPTSGTLTFGPGEVSKPIFVPIIDDTLNEPDETALVELSKPTGGATLGATSTALLTIHDNDPLPSLRVNDLTVTEGDSGTKFALFTVVLSAASGKTVQVNYATADGTATAGPDYLAESGTLVFAPGQTTKIVAVPVVGDTLSEPTEFFYLKLTQPSNATIADDSGACGIIDNDLGGKIVFHSASYSVVENQKFVTVQVDRVGGAASGVTVHVATSDGTAKAGSDYKATSQTLSFGAGETSKTFQIPIVDDKVAESAETFNLALSAPTGGATLGAPQTAVVKILDDDANARGTTPAVASAVAHDVALAALDGPAVPLGILADLATSPGGPLPLLGAGQGALRRAS
jgi:hypothetical protein